MEGPLDPALLAEVTARAKKQIRKRMLALRASHPAAALSKRSRRIVDRLAELPELKHARGVASFWPMTGRGEVDLRLLDEELRRLDKQLYYPFMDRKPDGGYTTGFRLTSEVGDLVDRGQRFLEPEKTAPVAERGEIQLVLVPALAVGAEGHRIGYGAGYYDATLGDVCPPARSVVVAYDFQLLAEVPAEAHDQSCDIIVTDSRTLRSCEVPPINVPPRKP